MSLMRYRCYHKRCGTRRTLKHPLEWYKRPPKCHQCGNTNLTLDRYRMKHEVGKGKATCNCDGYHFPHDPNSSVWCNSNDKQPTEQQYEERYNACPS